MTFTRIFIAGLAAAVLTASAASADALIPPSAGVLADIAGERHRVDRDEPAEPSTGCNAQPAPGPPTWWPGTPPCEPVSADATTARDERGATLIVLAAVLVVAALTGSAARLVRTRRRRARTAGRAA